VSIYIHKSHNVSVLIYHLVCVGKGRETWFKTPQADEEMKNVCLEIAKRYDINFLEIGSDQDHVHFLIQSVPMYPPTKIARMVKSITAREILQKFPDLKHKLWNGEFWSNGYFINTVGRSGSETVIQRYIKYQGYNNYKLLHKDQLKLFPSS
jgi:REP element-mobilizing transposase RayT